MNVVIVVTKIVMTVGFIMSWVFFIVDLVQERRRKKLVEKAESEWSKIMAHEFNRLTGESESWQSTPADTRARDEAMDDMIADYQVSVIRRVFEVDLRSAYNGERGTP